MSRLTDKDKKRRKDAHTLAIDAIKYAGEQATNPGTPFDVTPLSFQLAMLELMLTSISKDINELKKEYRTNAIDNLVKFIFSTLEDELNVDFMVANCNKFEIETIAEILNDTLKGGSH
jgi:hypothetical protein